MSSQRLADVKACVLNSNPPWLSHPLPDLLVSLRTLSRDELRTVASRISPVFSAGKHYDKLSCINLILEDSDSRSATSTSSKRMPSSRNAPLPYNTDIPTFDGRSPFKLHLYTSQPPIHRELDRGSAVLVIFTLGAYELSDGAAKNYNVNPGVSNNVQAVILLADAIPLPSSPLDAHISSNVPLHLGVLSETDSSDSDNEEEQEIENGEQSPLM